VSLIVRVREYKKSFVEALLLFSVSPLAMNPRLVITFLVCLVATSTWASNDWADFNGNDIYPKYDTSNCKFPFTYKGKSYNNCTTDGDNGDRPWCSLTDEYAGLFTYCYNFWESSLQCVFPFTLNGKVFEKCDFLSRTSKYKQCRSNNDAYRFRFCMEEHVKKSDTRLLRGNDCVEPFKSMSPFHSKW
jgi:hypothetical protein